jgi:LysR family nitrogen assimilation transcriptional regulator
MYFIKIVDTGNMTQASELLHIAQPALSQQLATLESEFDAQLLVRTKRGMAPTEAGKALYRHAQIMLRQLEQARSAVKNAGKSLSGLVTVGIVPGIAASKLALPLLKIVHQLHPAILLNFNENLGSTLGELVTNGRMDMALLYCNEKVVQGLAFKHLLNDKLCFVTRESSAPLPAEIGLADLRDTELLLPRPDNYLRKCIDDAFASASVAPKVVGEIESADTLIASIAAGIGATILPESAAQVVAQSIPVSIQRIIVPAIEIPLTLCVSDHLPQSESAAAVSDIILELIGNPIVEKNPESSPGRS